jgi:hypothetical protein
MPVTAGPIYPGIKDGLAFVLLDPELHIKFITIHKKKLVIVVYLEILNLVYHNLGLEQIYKDLILMAI